MLVLHDPIEQLHEPGRLWMPQPYLMEAITLRHCRKLNLSWRALSPIKLFGFLHFKIKFFYFFKKIIEYTSSQ